MSESQQHDLPVPMRLLDSAQECFLNDDYHRVSTRQIAARAGTNISMIRYYFGSKEGLYEEMIRTALQPLLDVLDSSLLSSTGGFEDYFRIYYQTMMQNPRFPQLVLKVLALNQGPGRHFIYQLLERGRTRSREKIEALKQSDQIASDVDPDVVRIAFVSLAMMPVLLKAVFEQQLEYEMDEVFFDSLAKFNGNLFVSGLLPEND
jgi:AcrR family transcriptional regulator